MQWAGGEAGQKRNKGGGARSHGGSLPGGVALWGMQHAAAQKARAPGACTCGRWQVCYAFTPGMMVLPCWELAVGMGRWRRGEGAHPGEAQAHACGRCVGGAQVAMGVGAITACGDACVQRPPLPPVQPPILCWGRVPLGSLVAVSCSRQMYCMQLPTHPCMVLGFRPPCCLSTTPDQTAWRDPAEVSITGF